MQVYYVTDEVFWQRDGTPFPVEKVSTPIPGDGRITGAVVAFRNVSERKQAEGVREQVAQERAARIEAEATTKQCLLTLNWARVCG